MPCEEIVLEMSTMSVWLRRAFSGFCKTFANLKCFLLESTTTFNLILKNRF